MASAPPLLIDTSSLLRSRLDVFVDSDREPNRHVSAVISALVVNEDIYLDGPSVERNSEYLGWLLDIDENVRILEIDEGDVAKLYRSAADLIARARSDPRNVDFMRILMPPELGMEIGEHFAPSTYWSDLERDLDSEDLRWMQRALAAAFGEHTPFSGAVFIALARLFYYLALQQQVGSSLLLDPLKGYEVEHEFYEGTARTILDLFDEQVGEAFQERKEKWLGMTPRGVRLPLLDRYVLGLAERNGWSAGRAVAEVRQSREAKAFRAGLGQLQEAVDSNDVAVLDGVFQELDAAAEEWSSRIGSRTRQQLSVTVSLPFISVGRELSLPAPGSRGAARKLLVFVDELLRGG